jgi:peptidoglycan hydrolase CwlO-like protein
MTAAPTTDGRSRRLLRRPDPRRRRTVAGAGLAIAILAAMGLSFAGAAGPSLKDRIGAAESDAGALNERIDSHTARISSLTVQARRAGVRAMELAAEIERAEERSRELAAQLTVAERQLDRARAEYADAVDALERRLVGIYTSEAPDYVSVLLSSDGFDDLSTRSDYLQALHDADMRVADRVAALRDEVASTYQEIAELKRDAEAETASLDATRADFEATQAEAKHGIAAIAQARSESQTDLSAVQDEIADLEAQQAEQQAEQQADREGAPLYEGGPYAIPTYIVMCESGGNYRALNPSSGAGGAYQILPSTWRAYGGQGLPHQAPPAEQDRIAAMIWRDSGPSAWSCA